MKKTASGTPEAKNCNETDPLLREEPWRWWRTQMPVADRWAYFDHAAVSPLSGPAAAAARDFVGDASANGDYNWPQWAATSERVREQFRELIHADSAEICLVPNTTSGVNLVAEGWPWTQGDNIILPEGEFPSNLFPWKNQAVRGVEVRCVPRRGSEVVIDDLLDRIDAKTRMIAVSWVGYASGFRIDLQRLVDEAHRRGVLVFLDAIQGLGIYPLDLRQTPVDFLAADGHKWLLGPEGLGVTMIRRPHLDRMRCGQVGWNSVKNAFNYSKPEFKLRDAASRFEGGSANMLGAAALSASLDLFLRVRTEHGSDAIAKRILSLAEILESRLDALGIKTRMSEKLEHRSGIVTFDLPGIDPGAFRKAALEKQVVLSCRDGGVRASVHAYNDEADLERLIRVVSDHL